MLFSSLLRKSHFHLKFSNLTLLDNCRIISGILRDYFRTNTAIYSFGGIVNKGTNKIYGFLDFEVNPRQRTLTKKSQAINLSKKSFDMLVVLLQRHGQLITKDELLSAVWPNQIITDSALNKQISRLRKIFDPADCKESIIETIRGVGIRLATNVELIDDETENTISPQHSYWKVVFISFVVITFGFLVYQVINQSIPIKHNTETLALEPLKSSKESLNIAIVPAQKTDEWLDIGGLNYLSELLQQHKEIESISPETSWFKQDDSNVMALQLSQEDNIDFSLLIKNIKQGDEFVSQIVLRNKHGILANGELHAVTLNKLFKKTDIWVIQQLNITSGVVFENSTHPSQISNFVIESYVRGLASARNREFKKASQFLQTAVNQNKHFFPAWLLLAEVEAELGNFQKALATTETIEKLSTFDRYYLNDLYNVKARALIYLNKLDEALIYLNKSIKISEQEKDMKAIIVSLSSQAMIQDRTGITDETLTTLSKQLALVKKHQPLPSLVADLNHNLAIVNQHLFHYDQAKIHSDLAIKQYQKLQNYTGLVSSYTVKSDIHNDLAETGLSLLALEKADKWLDKVDSPITLAHYYASKARNLYAQGYLTKAIAEIDKLQGLSIKYDNIEAKIMALTIQTEMQIVYNKLTEAKNTVKQMLGIVMINPNEHPVYAEYIVALDMYLSARTENAVVARKKLNDYLTAYPILIESISDYLPRIEAHIFAAEGYKNKATTMLTKLMEHHIGNSHFLEASYIGFEILELQWQNDMDSYLKTLNRIQELTSFQYPTLKFRAQYFASQNDFLNAAILMRELKPKAREFWSIGDQLLLEKFQSELKN